VTPIVVAFTLALLLQPLVVATMRHARIIDIPNGRSSHDNPTPRGGGLAVVTGMLVGLTIAGGMPLFLTTAVLTFAAIGLGEDLRGLTVQARLTMQLVAGAVTGFLLLQGLAQPAWALMLGVMGGGLWVAAYANVFNFMDGVNGISAAHGIVGGLAYTAIGHWLNSPMLQVGGAVLAASAAAFLPWNAWRPLIFLGDVGSYGLGAGLATLGLGAVANGVPPEAALGPLALYLADTSWTLLRRLRAGEPILRPHRSHVYQRLNVAGWSHVRIAATTAGLATVVSGAGFASLTGDIALRFACDGAAAALLVGYLGLPELLGRRAHRPVPLIMSP